MRVVCAACALVCLVACSAPEPKSLEKPKDERAPDVFRVNFDTSKGPFILEVHREWAPLGADRFYTLVRHKFFDNARFFRVISGFMAQFGLSADPAVNTQWHGTEIEDDPVRRSNTRGMVSFATAGAKTRTTQMFINFGDNSRLDHDGFSPFGQVVSGMDVVDQLYSGYGEQPQQPLIESQGNSYLEPSFPRLDYIKSARLAN